MALKFSQSRDLNSQLQVKRTVFRQLLRIASQIAVKLILTVILANMPINFINGSHLIIHYDDGYLEQELEIVYDSTINIDYTASTDSTDFKVEFETSLEK